MAKKTDRRKSNGAKPNVWGPVLGAIVGIAIVAGIFLLTDRGSEPATPQTPTVANPPQSQIQAPSVSEQDIARVRRIDARETKRLLDAGEAIAIDVRDVQSFVGGHIPGALQIPLQYVAGEVPWFPRDKTIITYCT